MYLDPLCEVNVKDGTEMGLLTAKTAAPFVAAWHKHREDSAAAAAEEAEEGGDGAAAGGPATEVLSCGKPGANADIMLMHFLWVSEKVAPTPRDLPRLNIKPKSGRVLTPEQKAALEAKQAQDFKEHNARLRAQREDEKTERFNKGRRDHRDNRDAREGREGSEGQNRGGFRDRSDRDRDYRGGDRGGDRGGFRGGDRGGDRADRDNGWGRVNNGGGGSGGGDRGHSDRGDNRARFGGNGDRRGGYNGNSGRGGYNGGRDNGGSRN